MTQPYHVILTDAGAAALAQAIDSGQPLQLAQIAAGDGGGAPITPSASATALAGECWRGALTDVRVDDDNPAWVIAETVIPPDAGGWWIREVGLYSAAGELVAIGSHPETYKPVLADGSATDLVIRMILQVSSTDAIQLTIDPSAVLASKDWVQTVYPWASIPEARDPAEEHKIIDPKRLHAAMDDRLAAYPWASIPEARDPAEEHKIIDPKRLHAAIDDRRADAAAAADPGDDMHLITPASLHAVAGQLWEVAVITAHLAPHGQAPYTPALGQYLAVSEVMAASSMVSAGQTEGMIMLAAGQYLIRLLGGVTIPSQYGDGSAPGNITLQLRRTADNSALISAEIEFGLLDSTNVPSIKLVPALSAAGIINLNAPAEVGIWVGPSVIGYDMQMEIRRWS